jgi:hypothetical protein
MVVAHQACRGKVQPGAFSRRAGEPASGRQAAPYHSRGIAFPEGVITSPSRERDFRLSDPDGQVLHQTLSRIFPNRGEFGPIPFAGPRVPR